MAAHDAYNGHGQADDEPDDLDRYIAERSVADPALPVRVAAKAHPALGAIPADRDDDREDRIREPAPPAPARDLAEPRAARCGCARRRDKYHGITVER